MTPERFAKLKRVLHRRQPDLTVLTDGVHKSHNVSAILRSCDAAGVHCLHAVAPRGAMRRHHMIAGGAARWVEVVAHPTIAEAAAALREEGWQVVAADSGPGSRDFRAVDYTRKTAVVLGAELHGLSDTALAAADVRAAIPLHGMCAALNVSVAAAVILFEAERQRSAAGLYQRSRLGPAERERTLFEWAYPDVARICRARGEPYPKLTEDGYLAQEPESDRTS
jgi:tRNA (guanosine-2'-O-)-methyltransferase